MKLVVQRSPSTPYANISSCTKCVFVVQSPWCPCLDAEIPCANISCTKYWNAIQRAQLNDFSEAIQERGMNNKLAERIQKFLDSVHDDKSGLLDLEWLRNAKPVKAMAKEHGMPEIVDAIPTY